MAMKVVLAILLCFVACESLVNARESERRQYRFSTEAQLCKLDRIRVRPPSRRIESEGGITELWDEADEEFQCAGVGAIRNLIRPNSLSLPKFHNAPMLVYIEQGEGFLGMNYPGCAETYESQSPQSSRRSTRRMGRRIGAGRSGEDQHQKIRRIRRGDIIVIPAGTVQWCYNDGPQDLIAVAFLDLNNDDNQLDLRIRGSFLAGGVPSEARREIRGSKSDDLVNIFNGFDQELLAEAYNIPTELARRMQEERSSGLIVKCDEEMSFLTPELEEEELSESPFSRRGEENGIEETICTARVVHNMNTQREADLFSREAGRVNILNQLKLPILRFLGMSAEKGHLFSNAQHNLHWSMTDHRLVYVIDGEAEIQISDDYGNQVFNERVSRGNMFVIPQFYPALARAGQEGFEWVTFKTSNQPMKSPVVGYTSFFRALPLQLLEQAFQITTAEAQQLKQTRRQHTFLFPPSSSSTFRSRRPA
ncbi:11S globulin seed storage protein 2-like [Benincasa hispida]|uniref:11S globulin seed storage protein 2-like n=1 Tax=Benincasa hispida TaxID=102211 RepID=UPI001901B623|nr:11S globulin seed storage protein 2-like [Benincasa hispida]